MPKHTARKVEPKPMTIEFTNRGTTFDGPPITMLRERTRRSYQVCGGGRLARNSGVCRERVVKRFTYPSTEGSNRILGGYAIESGGVLNPVRNIHNNGSMATIA